MSTVIADCVLVDDRLPCVAARARDGRIKRLIRLAQVEVLLDKRFEQGFEVSVGHAAFERRGKRRIFAEMAADHDRVDGHDLLADARATARQADVGDLRLRAGVEAARQVDAQRLADFRKGRIERCRQRVQAVLRLDWREVAVGVARARGSVAREEARL